MTICLSSYSDLLEHLMVFVSDVKSQHALENPISKQ